MMSDGEIREALEKGHIIIEAGDEDCIQPASVDLHLGGSFRVFESHSHTVIDPEHPQEGLTRLIGPDELVAGCFVLHPGEFVLSTTIERFKIPDNIVGRLEGKSSLARLGLLVHATGGFIDPGFRGEITLEMSNVNKLPIRLRPGMRIAQISFDRMGRAAERPYGHADLKSKYVDQEGPTESRYHLSVVGEGHFVTFDARGWFIEHPLDCRRRGVLGTCAYNDAIRSICDNMKDPDEHGRYAVTLDSEGLPVLSDP